MVTREFAARRWTAAYRDTVDRAFGEVPYYREQWAAAGRALDEPVPVPSAELTDQLFRLCPLGRAWRPDREPSLWTGEPAALLAALRTAGALTGGAVLEIRPAMVDWRRLGRLGRLGRRGPRYAAVLPPGADTAGDDRRKLLNARAATLANGALLVGPPASLATVSAELGGPATIPRLPLNKAVATTGPALAYDPCLGYYAARHPACGHLHLDWRRFHAQETDSQILLTALRRRPALCGVIPDGATGVTLTTCPDHRQPAFTSL